LRDDEAVQAGLWRAPAPPGEPIEMEYDHHETVLVLAGEAQIEVAGGPTFWVCG
jgi:uncharacterized cupin superfamily protein